MALNSSKTTISLGFAALAVIVLLNAAVSFFSSTRLSSANGAIARSQELLAEIEITLSALKDIETGQRGYFLTSDEAFLAPFYQGLTDVELQVHKLPELIQGNTELEVLFRHTEQEIQTIVDSDRTDVSRFKAGDRQVTDWLTLDESRRRMDEVRRHFGLMEQSERRALALREATARLDNQNLRNTYLVANSASVIIIAVTFFAIRRAFLLREQSEADLRVARDSLEEKVLERTRELSEANADLQREVSERLRAETELAKSAAELERSNRELQDFAYVASHDLQEPLRKIQAFADRLQARFARDLPAEASDYLARMDRAARRMHQLILDLLTFSRVRSHGNPLESVNLGEILREVLTDLEERIRETSASLEIGPLPAIDADPMQMRQLFQNLIGNALKFRRPQVEPHVSVTARLVALDGLESGAYEIAVEDNGIGFDEKYVERIFSPFQRLHSRHDYEGTGMGLAICRRIAERHGGTISARSIADKGSRFIVQLPAKARLEGNAASTMAATAAPSGLGGNGAQSKQEVGQTG